MGVWGGGEVLWGECVVWVCCGWGGVGGGVCAWALLLGLGWVVCGGRGLGLAWACVLLWIRRPPWATLLAFAPLFRSGMVLVLAWAWAWSWAWVWAWDRSLGQALFLFLDVVLVLDWAWAWSWAWVWYWAWFLGLGLVLFLGMVLVLAWAWAWSWAWKS